MLELIKDIDFKDNDKVLELCRGEIYDELPDNINKEWCEVYSGIEFFRWNKKVDISISKLSNRIVNGKKKKSINNPFIKWIEHQFSITNRECWYLLNGKMWSSMTPIRLNRWKELGWNLCFIRILNIQKNWLYWVCFSKVKKSIINFSVKSFNKPASVDKQEIITILNQNLKIKVKEKNIYGEVFTALELIYEMLDKLPKSVWKNKDLKWLDPANGIGNFPVIVYYKLMEGLELIIPDSSERSKHIIENMLYMVELNPVNCNECKKIFKMIDPKATPNIIEGDFLNYEEQTFDIIIGNPPYNKSKKSKLIGGYGGRSLWDKFVIHSIDNCLKTNGLLLFVHPPSWRKPEHKLWNKMTRENQIIYLKCFSQKEGKNIFNCSIPIDYYLLEKKPVYRTTIIMGQDKKQYEEDLKKWPFLPSGVLDIIKKLLLKRTKNNQVIYSRSLYGTDKKNIISIKDSNYKFPVMHNMTKKGYGYVYSNVDKGHYGVKKVILSSGQYQYPYNDYKGEYGMSQICYGLEIKTKSEGDKIIRAINSDVFKQILKYTKWSIFQTEWRMFKYFKKDFYKTILKQKGADAEN